MNTSQTTSSELIMPSRNLDYTAVERALILQLRELCNDAMQCWYVVGVSGGVDSAVVSTLCAKTWLPLYVVEMPIHQSEAEITRAEEHIAWLKSNFTNVIEWREDLTQVFDLMAEKISHVANTLQWAWDTRLALANTRSRLRMTSLYAMAGTFGLLVAGTGNRVEDYGIGFFTKYDDEWVDVSPIGDLYKSEVRELGRQMNILPTLTEAIPTDGLHTDGSTDEDQIGATYDELEWAMDQHDTYTDMASSNWLMYNDPYVTESCIEQFSGRAKQVMEIYTTRHTINQHKMKMPPVFRFPTR